jgi:hypothetical protein
LKKAFKDTSTVQRIRDNEKKVYKIDARVVYDMLFFFIVIIIVLNLIFGVIIDTFADLRCPDYLKKNFFGGKIICDNKLARLPHIFSTGSLSYKKVTGVNVAMSQ